MACFITQFIASCIGFNWMIYTFHFFGGMNWFLSFILLLFFCSTAVCYVVISGWLWFIVTKKSFLNSAPVKLFLLPLIFSVLHSLIPTLFPWDMGYPWFWGGLWGAQTAELWGFRFLDTLFYVFNLLFLIVYHHFSRDSHSQGSLPHDSHSHSLSHSRESGNLQEKAQDSNQRSIKKLMLSLTRIRLDRVGVKALSGAVFLFVFLNGLGLYLKKRLSAPMKT